MMNFIKYDKTKNSSRIKLFSIALCVLMSSCSDCGFSERCHREKERARILNITDQEREHEKDLCIKEYEKMISVTNHEKNSVIFGVVLTGKKN